MLPTIRYCATPAGRVAYSAAGTGPPLLCDSGWVTHLRRQLDLFSFRPFMARLAERFTVIRYDARHAMQVWCGLAGSKEEARACLAPAMQAFYQLPFERFERYCPYGTAEDVAEFLAPYVAAGAAEFNLIPCAPDPAETIAAVSTVKNLL